jgi:hypothetical protein
MRAIEKGAEAWRILSRRARAFDAPPPSRCIDRVPLADRVIRMVVEESLVSAFRSDIQALKLIKIFGTAGVGNADWCRECGSEEGSSGVGFGVLRWAVLRVRGAGRGPPGSSSLEAPRE